MEPKPKTETYLNRPFKALVCHASQWQTGIAYVYPEAYPGSNHLQARAGKDRKFRASLFADHYEVGQVSDFHLRVIPFKAQSDRWIESSVKRLGLESTMRPRGRSPAGPIPRRNSQQRVLTRLMSREFLDF